DVDDAVDVVSAEMSDEADVVDEPPEVGLVRKEGPKEAQEEKKQVAGEAKDGCHELVSRRGGGQHSQGAGEEPEGEYSQVYSEDGATVRPSQKSKDQEEGHQGEPDQGVKGLRRKELSQDHLRLRHRGRHEHFQYARPLFLGEETHGEERGKGND